MMATPANKEVLLFIMNCGIWTEKREDREADMKDKIASQFEEIDRRRAGSILGQLRRDGYILKEPSTGVIERGEHSGEGVDPEYFDWAPTGKAYKWLREYQEELIEMLSKVSHANEKGFVYRPEHRKDEIEFKEPREIIQQDAVEREPVES